MVEEDSAHIVQVSVQRKKTSPRLIRPDFDFVVVSPRHEQWLGFVKVDAANRSIMLLEPINQCSHAVVPQLDRGRMQGHEDPWSKNQLARGSRRWNATADLFGWKAIPLALEDLDSNYQGQSAVYQLDQNRTPWST